MVKILHTVYMLYMHIKCHLAWLYIYFSVLTFGFEPIMYSASESVGSLDFGVFFISGNAGQFVPHLNASTFDETSTGKVN